MTFIAPIVEGHGEIDALPALLHRIRDSIAAPGALQINQSIRVKSGSLLNRQDDFHRYVALAAAKAESRRGSVLRLIENTKPGSLLRRDPCGDRQVCRPIWSHRWTQILSATPKAGWGSACPEGTTQSVTKVCLRAAWTCHRLAPYLRLTGSIATSPVFLRHQQPERQFNR